MFGVSLSLCANIASAAALNAFGIVAAACPPLALLLAVELLNRTLKRHRATSFPVTAGAEEPAHNESPTGVDQPVEQTAEQRMWAFYETEYRPGRTPTGADLDRVAGTHNYGRRILRKWPAAGQLTSHAEAAAPREPVRSAAATDEV